MRMGLRRFQHRRELQRKSQIGLFESCQSVCILAIFVLYWFSTNSVGASLRLISLMHLDWQSERRTSIHVQGPQTSSEFALLILPRKMNMLSKTRWTRPVILVPQHFVTTCERSLAKRVYLQLMAGIHMIKHGWARMLLHV